MELVLCLPVSLASSYLLVQVGRYFGELREQISVVRQNATDAWEIMSPFLRNVTPFFQKMLQEMLFPDAAAFADQWRVNRPTDNETVEDNSEGSDAVGRVVVEVEVEAKDESNAESDATTEAPTEAPFESRPLVQSPYLNSNGNSNGDSDRLDGAWEDLNKKND